MRMISSRDSFARFGTPYGDAAIAYAASSRLDLDNPPPAFNFASSEAAPELAPSEQVIAAAEPANAAVASSIPESTEEETNIDSVPIAPPGLYSDSAETTPLARHGSRVSRNSSVASFASAQSHLEVEGGV